MVVAAARVPSFTGAEIGAAQWWIPLTITGACRVYADTAGCPRIESDISQVMVVVIAQLLSL